jgi:hypothetical protein
MVPAVLLNVCWPCSGPAGVCPGPLLAAWLLLLRTAAASTAAAAGVPACSSQSIAAIPLQSAMLNTRGRRGKVCSALLLQQLRAAEAQRLCAGSRAARSRAGPCVHVRARCDRALRCSLRAAHDALLERGDRCLLRLMCTRNARGPRGAAARPRRSRCWRAQAAKAGDWHGVGGGRAATAGLAPVLRRSLLVVLQLLLGGVVRECTPAVRVAERSSGRCGSACCRCWQCGGWLCAVFLVSALPWPAWLLLRLGCRGLAVRAGSGRGFVLLALRVSRSGIGRWSCGCLPCSGLLRLLRWCRLRRCVREGALVAAVAAPIVSERETCLSLR